MTPNQFFSKNLKWIALALLFLFLIKSVQSCNRQTLLNINDKSNSYVIDSLENKITKLETALQVEEIKGTSKLSGYENSTNNQINNLQKDKDNLTMRLNDRDIQIKDLRDQIKDLKQENEELKNQ
jgi:chromosome segregation ATPase